MRLLCKVTLYCFMEVGEQEMKSLELTDCSMEALTPEKSLMRYFDESPEEDGISESLREIKASSDKNL